MTKETVTTAGASRKAPAGAQTPSLTLDGISLKYGGVQALRDVSFTVSSGETCGIIGPNGAGKTSLFDVISGLRRPTSGTITLLGRDVTGQSAIRRSRAGLRRTFQRAQVFGRLTVQENLLAATEWRGGGGGLAADLLSLPSRRSRQRARAEQTEAVMEDYHLTALRDTYAGALPVGLARLVEFARAVIDHPKVLLLDEPTSGLDEVETGLLASAIGRLSASHETAVILVEHDMGFVMNNCARVIALDLGQVIGDGTPAEIQASPAVRTAYLS